MRSHMLSATGRLGSRRKLHYALFKNRHARSDVYLLTPRNSKATAIMQSTCVLAPSKENERACCAALR